jgi:nitroreductase
MPEAAKNILELATRRKTVRKFRNEEIPLDDLLYCIDVAKEALSGMIFL